MINSQHKKLFKIITGSTITHMYGKDLEKLKFVSPSLQEQQKIGNFFKNLDDLIDLQQKKITRLKELKKGYLQKMFPQKESKVPELRFAGFNDKWEEEELKNNYSFLRGKGISLTSLNDKSIFPAINYGNLYTQYHEVIFYVNNFSDEEGVLSQKNDLLFPGSSTVPNGTAQSNAIMLDNVKLGGDIIIARPKNINVYSPFYSYMINSQHKKLFKIITGSTITHMYGKDLEKIKFVSPSIREQQKIGNFFKNLDDLINLNQDKLDKLKESKKGFLQKMFF